MLNHFFNFPEMSGFYENYRPLTPYGIADKASQRLFTTARSLKKEHDLIDLFIASLKKNPDKISRIEYHLNKIPLVEFPQNGKYDGADIFIIKKFLMNYRAVHDQLNAQIINALGACFRSEDLIEHLNPDNTRDETFYISDKYSPELAKLRAEIKKLDQNLARQKNDRLDEIKKLSGLDFSDKDFLVISEPEAARLNRDFFYFESFDSQHLKVKPVYDDKYISVHAQKDRLIQKELEIEAEVLEKLSSLIESKKTGILKYANFVERIDVLLAKAKLAIKFGMTRPELTPFGQNIAVKSGRFVPQQDLCHELGTRYCPVDVEFDRKNIVINGANMGGKTVFLKSLAFFQILTQLGHYVPAKLYRTTLFEKFAYIGPENLGTKAGLSSFGLEIYQFNSAYSEPNRKCLFILDEFARTTNSREGLALTAAILEEFTRNKKTYSFLATHFMEIPSIKGLSTYRMKGLNIDDFKKICLHKTDSDLKERIKMINNCMNYNVVHETDNPSHGDAIKIAYMLGLKSDIISSAEKFLGDNDD